MAKKESVLSQAEKDSFEIEKFIFHIILESELNPIYLDEVDLDTDQITFFKERFKDVSEGVQHIFKEKNTSNFYKDCTQILKNPNKNFVDISQRLTASFRDMHKGNTNDGVFITSIVRVKGSRRLIFLLKIDHKKVYEYKVKNKKALLTEITQTFVEDKKAIQKSALVDVSNFYKWDVLATDRNATGRLALRTYFANFLTVIEKDTPSSLTPRVISTVTKWAAENKSQLGLAEDVASYKSRVIDYLKSSPKFDSNACIESILSYEDRSVKAKIRNSLKDKFDEVGLSGQSFVPNQNSIDRRATRSIRQTAEGVTIQWEGDPKSVNITLPDEPDPQDGFYHIVIKTSSYEILDKDI